MTYEEINKFGESLAALRLPGEKEVLVGIGSHAGGQDTPDGHMVAVVSNGTDEARSEALRLADAISLARHKVRAMEAKRIEAAKKAKEKA